jgi:SAM-dependent methyltransferase
LQIAEYFDEVYAREERHWWQGSGRHDTDPDAHPTSIVTQLLLRLLAARPAGRALDLGAGEGADAIRLARLGWEVDAVELSPVGAAKIAAFALAAGVEVAVHTGDARRFAGTGPYDLVICNGLLHYVADKDPLVGRMQDITAPGGWHAVSLWSTYTPVPECHRIVPTFPDDEDGVVAARYRSWTKALHLFERDKVEASHDDMAPHHHSHIKVIARKEPRG